MHHRPLLLALSVLLSFPFTLAADGFSSVAATGYDGSLWVAGDSGVLRIGRNGRAISYGEDAIGTSTVTSIVADPSGNIFLLGGDGLVRCYSFLDGFLPLEGLPSGVSALASNLITGQILASTSDALYSWTSGSRPIQIAALDLPSGDPVTSIVPSADGAIWIVSSDCLFRLESGGSPIKVSTGPKGDVISKTIHLEIETNKAPGSLGGHYLIVVLALLALCTGVVAIYLFFSGKRRQKSLPDTAPESPAGPLAEVSEGQVVLPGSLEEPSDATPVSPSGDPPSELFPPSGNAPQQDEDFVTCVKRIIDDNISTPKFGVDEISQLMGLSRIHLNRKLKAAGCPSPSVLLKDARMKYAAELVSAGNLSFQQIALRCGFSSASYFTTAFRDYFGVTPSDYTADKS